MASTTFNGPVRSEKGFEVATKNATTGAVTTRYSSALPDMTGLAKLDLATGANITLQADKMNIVNYTGAAACAAALPAATQGTVVVYVQAKDTTGGVNTLTFDAAGTDVWATGSVIESRAADEVDFDIKKAMAKEAKLKNKKCKKKLLKNKKRQQLKRQLKDKLQEEWLNKTDKEVQEVFNLILHKIKILWVVAELQLKWDHLHMAVEQD